MIDRLLALGRRLQTRLMLARFGSIRQAGRDLHIGAGSRFWAPEGILLGNAVYVGKEVLVECNAEIGDYVLIANRVALVGRHDHDFRSVGVPVRFSPWIGGQPPGPHRAAKVVVESDVWIGYGATVLSGTRLGRGAIVAAGSVVTRDVPPYAIVAGNPARVVGQRFADAETIRRHEAQVAKGDFRFSERGYRHWVVRPGLAAAESET